MAWSRIAAALHELAAAVQELGEDDRAEVQNRPRRSRAIARPPGESDELARAAARRALREHGFWEEKDQ